MKYQLLSPTLHLTGDSVVAFLKAEHGLTGFKVETTLKGVTSFTTTLHTTSRDHHYICIEVSESAYTNSLDQFVLECRNKSLPVRLYVAFPHAPSDSQFKASLQRAHANGVGLIEVKDGVCTVLHAPLSLSLTGIRKIDSAAFPPKYRQALALAQDTFLNGNPAKGCADVYDEIEAHCRKIAIKAHKAGFLGPKGKSAPMDFANASWASLIQYMQKHFKATASSCPELSTMLLSGILALTPQRNATGHRPASQTALIKRDRQLRTRFEHAVDTYLELINACKKLAP